MLYVLIGDSVAGENTVVYNCQCSRIFTSYGRQTWLLVSFCPSFLPVCQKEVSHIFSEKSLTLADCAVFCSLDSMSIFSGSQREKITIR
jgi:hypothetical protein